MPFFLFYNLFVLYTCLIIYFLYQEGKMTLIISIIIELLLVIRLCTFIHIYQNPLSKWQNSFLKRLGTRIHSIQIIHYVGNWVPKEMWLRSFNSIDFTARDIEKDGCKGQHDSIADTNARNFDRILLKFAAVMNNNKQGETVFTAYLCLAILCPFYIQRYRLFIMPSL